jgi:hypothetical protein
MLAAAHHGTTATLPVGMWCVSLVSGRAVIAYRCTGCALVKSLFCSTVADDGTIVPDLFCGVCRVTVPLRLAQWDPDPC